MTHPTPSTALPGLIWMALDAPPGEDPNWVALLDGAVAQDTDGLAALVGKAWEEPGLRFEAWHAFTLGMDGFLPIVHPSVWVEHLARAPIDTNTGLPQGEPIDPGQVRAPHVGPHGLEGCILHPASGHVLRAIVGGLPPHVDLPVLIPLTAGAPTPRPQAEVVL
jgi:hypothetical protein